MGLKIPSKSSRRDAVVVGRSMTGKVFSRYAVPGGGSVKIMDAKVFRKASQMAGKVLREYAASDLSASKSKTPR